MSLLAVIPARMESSRLPGKPLMNLGDRPIIQWVYEATVSSGFFRETVVATDSAEVVERVRGFGGVVELTESGHPTGSDRAAEVASRRSWAEVVVNVQADQPFLDSAAFVALVGPYQRSKQGTEVPALTTVACPLDSLGDAEDPNVVKVVRNREGWALYFSRAPIPYRGGPESTLRHLGLYAFRRDALLRFAGMGRGVLEKVEGLEQLRALENGLPIWVGLVERPAIEINTPRDLQRAEAALAGRGQ